MVEFTEYLRGALQGALPGATAQQRMAPRLRDGGTRLLLDAPSTARRSAVAVLVCRGAEPAVLLTRRSERLRHHRGQLSFPGGGIEGTESPIDAALRELREEVGITREQVEPIGMLSPLYIPPSNSAVVPVVMACERIEAFVLDGEEVEEAFWVELRLLMGTAVEEEWELPYGRAVVPHWRIHPSVPLWGATAIMLSELLWFYERWLTAQAAPAATALRAPHPSMREDRSAE